VSWLEDHHCSALEFKEIKYAGKYSRHGKIQKIGECKGTLNKG